MAGASPFLGMHRWPRFTCLEARGPPPPPPACIGGRGGPRCFGGFVYHVGPANECRRAWIGSTQTKKRGGNSTHLSGKRPRKQGHYRAGERKQTTSAEGYQGWSHRVSAGRRKPVDESWPTRGARGCSPPSPRAKGYMASPPMSVFWSSLLESCQGTKSPGGPGRPD